MVSGAFATSIPAGGLARMTRIQSRNRVVARAERDRSRSGGPGALRRPRRLCPAPPPDCDSPEVQAEAEAVRDFPRTFITNYKAFYWQSPEGLQYWPYRYADKWMFEDGLDRNPPRAARVYALIAAAQFDAFIASQDGKFTYWYIRPHQLLPAIVPLFPGPQLPELSVESLDVLRDAV